MGVRFLHAADFHLGSPLELLTADDVDRGDQIHRATKDALERIIDVAIETDIDFVVVSGDLYDERARSVEANEFLIAQFERLTEHGLSCYIIHGNHDPLHDGAERLEWPANVHVFPADDVEMVDHHDTDRPAARILGQSYGQQWESNSLYWQYTPPDRSVPNIGVLHTGLNPDGNRYAPAAPSDLATKDIDYWALGHIHTPGRVTGASAAYPGIPQGRHVGEVDVGGCYIVEVESNAEPNLQFVPTSPVVWQRLDVDVGAATISDGKPVATVGDLASHLVERVQARRNAEYSDLVPDAFDVPVRDVDWSPEGIIVRVELMGRGDVYDQLDDESVGWLAKQVDSRLPSGVPAVWIHSIRNRTSPPLPAAEILREEDEVVDGLHQLVSELEEEEAVRQDLREVVGAVWEWTAPEGKEDVPDTRIALDDDSLDNLINRALRRATDELALERYNVD